MKTIDSVESLSDKDRQLLSSVKQIVHGFLPDATILLYGSVARGTQDPDSDYDVLILTERSLSNKDEDDITDAIYDLELEHGILISTMIYTHEQWNEPIRRAMPLHANVEMDGILL